MSAPPPDLSARERWRLMLGEAAQGALGGASDTHLAGMDRALAWLYGRDEQDRERDVLERFGGDAPSSLSVPDWINEIHELFPKETIERLERDALRLGIDEVVTNPEVLKRAQPNAALLEAVLRTKHLMNPDVLALARELVRKVVEELMAKLAREVRRQFGGTRRRTRLLPAGTATRFAARETIQRNLRHYQPATKRLVVQRPLFHESTRRHIDRWQLVILVDQSGSMVSSVIHSAVMASCLWGLAGIKAHLVAFDTAVVDLTSEVEDPVEVLMRVQLGGGTDIAGALAYGASLIEVPSRAIVVLVTDFYEGGETHRLLSVVRSLAGQGTKVLGLAALDQKAAPEYDRDTASRFVEAGGEVGAMTPGQLANWLAEKLR